MNCSEFCSLLDQYIDGELDDVQIAHMKEHADSCSSCKRELEASEQLRDILSHMDKDVSVPLQAQAAWRKAVKNQAHQRMKHRIYRFAGAAAAALVLTIGLTSALHGKNSLPENEQGVMLTAHVEADGISEEGKLENSAAPDAQGRSRAVGGMNYVERTVLTTDGEQAYQYLTDILAEYGGEIEREAEDTSGKRVYTLIPIENAEDFIRAVEHIGEDSAEDAVQWDETANSVSVCVIIAEQ